MNDDEVSSVGLRKKLLAVMEAVSYLQKDKRNEFHKYSYASEALIKKEIHSAFVKLGLLFHFSMLSYSERQASNGKDTVMTVELECYFEDVDSGDTSRPFRCFGSGSDSLDKACPKAIVSALKYALTTTFLIPTGDDPEGEENLTKADRKTKQKEVEERKLQEIRAQQELASKATVRPVQGKTQPLITEGQRKRMYAIANQSKLSKEDTKLILGGYGFTSSTEVTVDVYDGIVADLERCSKNLTHLPVDGNYSPGNHVRVGGAIHRLSDGDVWEPVAEPVMA